MEKNDRKPEIRFSGFETSWKKKCFGDEFDILSNNTLSRDCLNYNQGIAKNVHYGDVLIKFNEYLDASKEVLPYIEDEKVIDKFQNSFLRDGDIVIADTAEDETVGKCTEIGQIRDLPIIAGLHTMPCRPKSKYAPMYLGYYLNANAYHRELLPLMQGVKVKSISRSGVKDTDIIVSEEYDEQKKIGQYLFALDEKIKFEKDKLDRLIILKKSMLVKMFPQGNSKVPEIRFGKYTDDWEQRKLWEYCEMYNGDRGINYPNDKDMVSDGIPFINAGDLKNGKVNLFTSNKITREKYSQLGGAKLQLGDIVYCLRGTLGKNAFIDNFDEGTVASSLVALRPKNIDGKYLFHILNSDIEFRQRTVCDEGAAQPNLSAKNLGGFEIPIPKIEEQIKISRYLDNLDNLITLHQRKVDKLKNIKSSCMDKMFV